MNREKLPIYGNGLNVRDWIHVSDHCKAIELVLDKGKSGEIYNIGGGEEITNLELAERLLTQFNLSFEHIEFVDDRLGHDFRYSVNWSKIERELGFHPQNSFEANLRDTTDWYLRNPDWWVS
jgi:dTDP-glucose 4,6-dehydratase